MFRTAFVLLLCLFTVQSDAGIFPRGTAPTAIASFPKTLIGGFDRNGQSFAFINFAKTLGSCGGATGWQLQVNSDGYPLGPTFTTGYTCNESIDAQSASVILATTVRWRIKWTGSSGGTFGNSSNNSAGFTITNDALGCASVAGGTLRLNCTMNGTTDFVEYTNGAGADQLSWNFNQFQNYDGTMSDLRIYRASDETAMNAGEIFTPEFISLLSLTNGTGLAPRYLRLMDWGNTNGSLAANFSQRTRTTSFTYIGDQILTAALAGSASGTNTYTASNPSGSGSGAYVQGELFQVLIPNANTAAATINFGSRGAAAMGDFAGNPLVSGSIPANALVTCTYDTDFVKMLCNIGAGSVSGGNNANGGNPTGVPIEIQVALANKLGTSLWYNIPFLYTNSSITSVVNYVRDNLNSTALGAFEYSNEVWNFLFAQTSMATYKGQFLGFPVSSARASYSYYGFKHQSVMTTVTAAWSPRSTSTLRRVLANWEGDADPVNQSQFTRMNGGDLQALSSTITGVSASSTTPTVTAANSYAPGQGLVISGITGTGAISALNGQTVFAILPTSSNYIATSRGWIGGGYISGTTFNVTSTFSGAPAIGQYLDNGGGIANSTIITGGSGSTWTVSVSQTVGSAGGPSSIQGYAPISTAGGTYISGGSAQSLYTALGNASHATGSPTFNRPIDISDSISYAQYEAGAIFNNGGAYDFLNAADVAAMKTAVDANDLTFIDDDIREGIYNRQTFTASGATFTTAVAPSTGTLLQFKVSAGGTLPTGINATTLYYALNLSGTTFQVRNLQSNTAISVSGGSGTFTWGIGGGETMRRSQALYIADPNNLSKGYEPIAASYDGARPAGFSNVKVEQYEGGWEMLPPLTDTFCNNNSLSTSYCKISGLIDTYINNYRNSALGKQYVIDHFTVFMNVSPGAGSNHSVTPAWFALQGPSQWSLMPGGTFSTPYQGYDGNVLYNHTP